MRLVMAIALYLGYIRSFCDYLLTGQLDPLPVNPAGLLAHSAQLDTVLARPDGVLLCVLFAMACYGVVMWVDGFVGQALPWLVRAPTHVDYDVRGVRANFGSLKSATPKDVTAKEATAPGQSASIL